MGRLCGGSGRNIVAADAYLETETRGITGEWNQHMRNSLEKIARAAGEMYGVECEILEQGEAGSASSSPELVRRCRGAAEKMGSGCLFRDHGNFQASEDAAVLMQKVQEQGGEAAYFMFGTPLAAEHHQPEFNFDEEVMAVMAEFYGRVLLEI